MCILGAEADPYFVTVCRVVLACVGGGTILFLRLAIAKPYQHTRAPRSATSTSEYASCNAHTEYLCFLEAPLSGASSSRIVH